jgi:endonuclease G
MPRKPAARRAHRPPFPARAVPLIRRPARSHRGAQIAKVIGAVGPLAAAGIALATPQAQPVPIPPPGKAVAAVPAPVGSDVAPPPVGGMDSPDCLKRYGDLAPTNAADAKARESLVCRRTYLLAFDADTRDPDWVMERLSPDDLKGSAKRSNAFRQDPFLKGADAGNWDYAGLHYDRGHQAPAGDARFTQKAMNDSFYFSNMAPQVGIGFNRGAWKYLEENVRAWVMCGGHPDVVVYTGPVYDSGGKAIGRDKVAVPRAFFKIVYDTQNDRAVGFLLPNTVIGATIDLSLYVKPIADIETATGLTFFSHYDQRRQALLKASAGTPWGHTASCAGDAGD